jgi:uncharacterized membrane protein
MLMVRETQKVGRWLARSDARRGAYLVLLPLSTVLAWSEPALAYVGPGAGISMLGALGAVIVAILFALGGLIWWPVRTMRRRRKQAANAAATADGNRADSD